MSKTYKPAPQYWSLAAGASLGLVYLAMLGGLQPDVVEWLTSSVFIKNFFRNWFIASIFLVSLLGALGGGLRRRYGEESAVFLQTQNIIKHITGALMVGTVSMLFAAAISALFIHTPI